ncbi:MAG: recombinase family protein, partial [Chloroflexota bacterium]
MPKNRNFQPVEPLPGWAIYLRTSSKDAQNPKTSKERQRRNIQRALIDPNELPVIEVYSDTETGTNPNRANYQRMLRDARQGRFSHVAVENADRFGRDDAEALRAINELERLGVTLRFADYPDIDPTRPDERLVVTVMLSMAQRESKKLGERVRGGQLTKLLNGGHLGRAPDGYVNRREKVTGGPREQSGRTYSWVEVDTERSEIWRYAWDLLLTDQYTLKEICEKLHERGYTLRSGRHFVVPPERG